MVIDIDVDEEQVDKALEGLEAVEGIFKYAEDKPGFANILRHIVQNPDIKGGVYFSIPDLMAGNEVKLTKSQMLAVTNMVTGTYQCLTKKHPVITDDDTVDINGKKVPVGMTLFPSDMLAVLENAVNFILNN